MLSVPAMIAVAAYSELSVPICGIHPTIPLKTIAIPPPPSSLFLSCQGGADAIGLGNEVGSFQIGKSLDAVVLDASRGVIYPRPSFRPTEFSLLPSPPLSSPFDAACTRAHVWSICFSLPPPSFRPARQNPHFRHHLFQSWMNSAHPVLDEFGTRLAASSPTPFPESDFAQKPTGA